jgi:1,4-dihydroxy-6-naphthoate synthase
VDLGHWWESETRLPIPLGGIVARRSLGGAMLREVEGDIRRSVALAFADPGASTAYVAEHAREMDASVCRRHIELYVNPFSVDLQEEGVAAVRELLRRAADAGFSPRSEPFVDG